MNLAIYIRVKLIMDGQRVAFVIPSTDEFVRYKRSYNLYMAIQSVNTQQVQHIYSNLIDSRTFPTISNYMNSLSVDYGLVKDTNTLVSSDGYYTNINIPFNGATTRSLFFPLNNVNGMRYTINGTVYEIQEEITSGMILLIPSGVQLLQFPGNITGSLLVSDSDGRGKIKFILKG